MVTSWGEDMKMYLAQHGRVHAVQGEIEGCASSYGHFSDLTYLMFFTPCLHYLCLDALFTGVCHRGVCWCIHAAEASAVHVMNEIVRRRWIYDWECSDPSRPAVPGCPQGRPAPLGLILRGDPCGDDTYPPIMFNEHKLLMYI